MEQVKRLQALAEARLALVMKPKEKEVPGIYREVGLHVLQKSLQFAEVLRNTASPIYLPILNTCTVAEIKRRIRGLTNIAVRQMILIYRGSVLHDESLIPDDAFEASHPMSFFEDLYRPKLFLRIFSDENVDDGEEGDGDGVDSASEDVDDEDNNALGDMFLEGYEQYDDDQARPANADDVDVDVGGFLLEDHQLAKYLKDQSFDLRSELERIGCDSFHDVLFAEGYADEVRGHTRHILPDVPTANTPL